MLYIHSDNYRYKERKKIRVTDTNTDVGDEDEVE